MKAIPFVLLAIATLGVIVFLSALLEQPLPFEDRSTPTAVDRSTARELNAGQAQAESAVAASPLVMTGHPESVIRREVREASAEEVVEETLAGLPTTADIGINTLRQMLLDTLNDATKPAVFKQPLPAVDDYIRSREFNPLAVTLSSEDRVYLASMMSEYASRLDRLRYEEYLYTNLGCIDAILAGRVKTVPNVALDGSPQHLAAQAECQRVDQEIKSAFADRNDYNCSAVPGPDYSCNRRVWSTRESNARMFRTRDRLTAEKAELGIAIRTFFLSRSRR